MFNKILFIYSKTKPVSSPYIKFISALVSLFQAYINTTGNIIEKGNNDDVSGGIKFLKILESPDVST